MGVKIEKFDPAKRNFETRLLFIQELFMNKYDASDIMAHCIEHKLDKSFEAYTQEIRKSMWKLDGKDPIKVLKRIDD